MAGSAEGGRKWFKYGCFGCLGCLGLLIVISLGTTGIAWLQSRSAVAEDEVVTREVPAVPESDETVAPDAVAEDARLATTTAPGRVVLDLGQGEVGVFPAGPGEPIRIEARYDREDCRLEENFEEGADGEWTYTVKFRRVTASGFLTGLKEAFAGTSPRVRVYLPRGVPLELDLQVRQGGGEVDLGGLWLTNAEITFEMGGGELRFGEPLHAPMESLSIDFSMGGGAVTKVGNASPRKLDTSFRMGGGELDLSGAWLQDSDITIKQSMGGVVVVLPDGVNVMGVAGRSVAPPADEELKKPTLRLTTSSEMGNLEFVN